jgi:hypothetical protein
MRTQLGWTSGSVVLVLAGVLGGHFGCGSDSGDDSTAGPPASSGGKSGSGGSSGNGGSAGELGAGGDSSFTPKYGRFGEPEVTFTLPKPAGEVPPLGHENLMEDFPDVDWENLDRLYIPAGEYETILLGGLPERDADHKLVITNLGGQVKVGGHAANFVFSIRGGKNWVLTGRYDPESATGDASYRGHAEGAIAHSQGTYGIFIDDAFSKEGHTGLAIGGGATDFEIDCLEVTRAEFAGIMAKTDDDGSATMRNVKLHDTYVHDVGSEGIYFGSTQAQPQHAFENLEIYDNRFIRTGTEALQVGQLGDGADIHHNVLGPAAIRWRSAFQKYQDGNVQYGQRYGSSSFHHNVVIGTGDLFVEFFPTVVDGDPRSASDTVTFSDNYFADTSLGGVYTHADDTGVNIVFENNFFRGFHFNYAEVYPDTAEPVQVFGVGSNSPNPHLLKNNQYEAPYPFVKWTFPSVTQENNVEVTLDRVSFRNFMIDPIEENFRRLEWWTATATLAPGAPEVVYPAGAYVMHQGTLYEALVENGSAPPDENPELWKALEAPADDVRVVLDSTYSGLGIRLQ